MQDATLRHAHEKAFKLIMRELIGSILPIINLLQSEWANVGGAPGHMREILTYHDFTSQLHFYIQQTLANLSSKTSLYLTIPNLLFIMSRRNELL